MDGWMDGYAILICSVVYICHSLMITDVEYILICTVAGWQERRITQRWEDALPSLTPDDLSSISRNPYGRSREPCDAHTHVHTHRHTHTDTDTSTRQITERQTLIKKYVHIGHVYIFLEEMTVQILHTFSFKTGSHVAQGGLKLSM